jgi:hypothetical protein
MSSTIDPIVSEDLDPVLSGPAKVAAGVLLASIVPCFSFTITTSSDVNGVLTTHSTNYAALAFGTVALLAAAAAGVVGITARDRRGSRVALAGGIAFLAVLRLIVASGVLG